MRNFCAKSIKILIKNVHIINLYNECKKVINVIKIVFKDI